MHRPLFIFALSIGLFASCNQAPAPQLDQPSVAVPTGTVTLEFVLADETKVVKIDDVSEGATLESVLRNVADPQVSLRGSGATAFVDKIGDAATTGNEGWTFSIDGEWASEGVGSTELFPPTTVRWEFGKWDK